MLIQKIKMVFGNDVFVYVQVQRLDENIFKYMYTYFIFVKFFSKQKDFGIGFVENISFNKHIKQLHFQAGLRPNREPIRVENEIIKIGNNKQLFVNLFFLFIELSFFREKYLRYFRLYITMVMEVMAYHYHGVQLLMQQISFRYSTIV